MTEDHPLVPLTLYNKFKGMCEPLLWKHKADDFTCVVIRPATVCGYSPRTRLDLSVNILTNHAVNKGIITVFGGNQMRPNLHIEDMVDAYLVMLEAPHEKIHGETFNIGFQNYSIAEIANMVKQVVEEEMPEKGEIKIVTTPTNDMRSYHVNSDKVTRVLGFEPKRSIEDAVRDLDARLPQSPAAAQLRRRLVLQRPHDEEDRSEMSAGAQDRGRHRRRRLHRQPHGRSPGRTRLSRPRHRQSDRRPRGQSRPAQRQSGRRFRSAPTSATYRARQRAVRAASTTCSISPGSATSCRRSSGRSNTCRSTCRARCTCSNARAHAGVKKFVYAASSSCYGLAATPTREDHPIAPQYPYALSKYQGEQAAFHWHKVYRLPVNSIRIFNAYGTRSRTSGAYGAVFGVFLKQKLAGKPFTVVGDGTQTPRLPLRHRRRRRVPARGRDADVRRDLESRRRQSAIGQPAGRAARRPCRAHSRSAPASPTAPWPISARSRAISAGRRRSASRRASRASSPTSNIGATRRSGTPDSIAKATTVWFNDHGMHRRPTT